MAKLIVDGVEYEYPENYDMDEWRLIKRYSGMTPSAFLDPDGIDWSDPDVTAALIHIAMKRKNPHANAKEIERYVGKVKYANLDFASDEKEEEDLPPAVTPSETPSAPEKPSAPSENSESSGGSSNGAADVSPETIPSPTGTPV
jgi:hypothetical protein